jgi:hypothetical protein
MDKTASKNKNLLGQLRKCCSYPNLYRSHRILLAAIVGNDLKIDRSTYEILQVLGISLLDKTPVKELFTNTDYNDVKKLNYNQLSISLF